MLARARRRDGAGRLRPKTFTLLLKSKPSLSFLARSEAAGVLSTLTRRPKTGRLRPIPATRTAVGASPKRLSDAHITHSQLSISLRHFGLVSGKQHLYAVDCGPFLHLLDERP